MRTRGLTRRHGEARDGSANAPAPHRPSSAALVYLRGRDADGRLRELEAQRARLRPVLGALSARLVQARCWDALGYRCIGDWSRERLGVGGATVRQWARVWSRLDELPVLRDALLAGELSWAVAREIVPHVTPETQREALDAVRGRTVRAVRAIVAALRGVDEDGDGDADDRVRVRIPCAPRLAGKWAAAVELARRVAGEELPVWECADRVAAEVAAALGREEEASHSGELARSAAGGAARRARAPDDREHGLRHVLWPHLSWRPVASGGDASEIDDLASGLESCTPHDLDARFRAIVQREQRFDLELGRILRQVVDRRLWAELGFESFARYVMERLDLSVRTAERLVRLARAEARAPAVAEAFREGRITAFQADVLLRARLERADEAPRLVARAESTTLRRLEDEVGVVGRSAVGFAAPPEAAAFFCEVLERVRARLARARGEPAGSVPLSEALEAMLDHAIAAWTEVGDQFHDYADFERDGFRCTVPGCTARRQLESHHVIFRSRGGPDVSWNRITVCHAHHHHGIHAGRVRVVGRAPDGLRFALGVRPDGPPLAAYRSGDVAM